MPHSCLNVLPSIFASIKKAPTYVCYTHRLAKRADSQWQFKDEMEMKWKMSEVRTKQSFLLTLNKNTKFVNYNRNVELQDKYSKMKELKLILIITKWKLQTYVQWVHLKDNSKKDKKLKNHKNKIKKNNIQIITFSHHSFMSPVNHDHRRHLLPPTGPPTTAA